MAKKELTGYNYVAIVNILTDCNHKDYAFALYDADFTQWQAVMANAGDTDDTYFVVSANGNWTVARLVRIVTLAEYMAENNGQKPKKEVISVCDVSNYNVREACRKAEAQKEARKIALSKDIDERIAKLKDAAYYRRIADEFGSKDPELKELIDELVAIAEQDLVTCTNNTVAQ